MKTTPMKKKCTIRDVAAESGLSIWTVSKVLSDREPKRKFPEATRRRVRDAARKLDYVPNVNAQRFFRNRSYVIGILVPPLEERNNAFTDPHFADIMLGLEAELCKTPYHVMFFFNHEEFKEGRRYAEIFRSGMIDGLLIWGVHRSDRYWNHLQELTQPVLFLATTPELPPDESVNYVTSDYCEDARRIVHARLSAGPRRVLWLAGQRDTSIYSSLRKVILDEFQAAGIPEDRLTVCCSTYDFVDGVRLTAEELEKNSFDLVFTTSSPLAEGAQKILDDRDLRNIPIVSFDCHLSPASCGCRYSALKTNDREIGRLAFHGLVDLMERKSETQKIQIRVPAEFCNGIDMES